jgi:hypothetical protein
MANIARSIYNLTIYFTVLVERIFASTLLVELFLANTSTVGFLDVVHRKRELWQRKV